MPHYLSTLTVGEIVAGLTALGVVIAVFRKVFPWLRNVVHFMDDLTGEAARKGRPAQPGLLERQLAVEETLAEIQHAVKELRPNGGGSIKDVANRVDTAIQVQGARMQDLSEGFTRMETKFDEHVMHGQTSEVEIRAAVAALQAQVFKS